MEAGHYQLVVITAWVPETNLRRERRREGRERARGGREGRERERGGRERGEGERWEGEREVREREEGEERGGRKGRDGNNHDTGCERYKD